MKDYKHPLGNIKIRFIKFTANAMGRIILFILSFFLNINKKKSEIIISSAIYAPWKDDIEFKIFSEKVTLDTLLDLKRL